jgi:hypothetical protein
MLFSFHDVLLSFKVADYHLLNHHLIEYLTQIVIPVIHKGDIPGEKPVDPVCERICLFFGQHHHNFFVLKKLFFHVQLIKAFFAGNKQDYNGRIHAGPDPADGSDAVFNTLEDLDPVAGQLLLNPL